MKFRVYRVIQEIEGTEHRARVSLIADENSGVLMELTGPMRELKHMQKGDSYEFGAS